MSDIHTIAERFLRDLEKGHAHFYAANAADAVQPLAEKFSDRVLVMREEEPHYLAGIKPSGRPVFTHDIKLAQLYDSASLNLVGVLRRLNHYNVPVETMPAPWFSNHGGIL